MEEPTLEYVMEPEHIFRAMRRCGNGVRWKATTQKFEVDALRWAATLQNDVMNGEYKSRGFMRFDVRERGKTRHIQAVHISERAVQKLLCDYALKPTILPRLIYDNSASQEGKGVEFALKRLKEHLRWHYARFGKTGAVAVMDYSAFFDSIPHAGAIGALTDGIADGRIRRYVADFIDAFDGEFGLGLGSETCQIGAICYPNAIDHFIKERLKIRCYGRYMDDSYIIHPDRRYVEHCLSEIDRMARKYGLTINREKTKVYNLKSDDFTFLKKRVRLTGTGRIILRISRENYRAEKQRIRAMKREADAGRMPRESIRQSYQSWRGYAGKCDNYGTIGKMDRYFKRIMGGYAAGGHRS